MTTIFQKNRFKLPTNGVAVNEQLASNCDQLQTSGGGGPNTLQSSTTPTTHLLSSQNNLMIKEEIVEEEIVEVGNILADDDDATKNDEKPPPPPITTKIVRGPPEPVINNVVCSFSVGCHLNLRQIATLGIHVEFRRESGMVTMKLRKPRVTASIWSSGKITCTGATSEDDAKIGARRVARVIQKLGFQAKFRRMRVVNVLGCCSMPFGIKINAFSQEHREAEYEPELHPGVTYKIKELKATLKIFSTGSITVTAPSVENVRSAIKRIYPLVYEFRKEFVKDELLTMGSAAAGKRALTTAATAAARLDNKKRKRLNSNNSRSSDEDSII